MIYLLNMQFDEVRQVLMCFSEVSETTAFISYVPDVGIIWTARGDNDRLPVVLNMDPESYDLTIPNVEGAEPQITDLTFDVRELYAMVRMDNTVPAGCELQFYIDPEFSDFLLVLAEPEGNMVNQTIECHLVAEHQIGPAELIPQLQWDEDFLFELPNDLMRSALRYSQPRQTAIALITWGHFWMICCGNRRRIFCQDVVPAGFQPPYMCYRLSFHRNHQNTWINRAFRLTDQVVIGNSPPLASFTINENISFSLFMAWDSFVKPQVLP